MKKILIADSSKASLVMTSEVFKDHYPGIQVLVAKNSAEALALAKKTENIDAFIVDFDLPDKDGAQTALMLKKISKIPTLITAFDKEEVVQTIESVLLKYPDCRSWLKKPVNPEVVIAVAQRYCEGKMRIQKRIACLLPALINIEFASSQIQTAEPLAAKTKSKGAPLKAKKTETKVVPVKSKKLKPEVTEQNISSLSFYGMIEDCSLSGVKLKPSKQTLDESMGWTTLLKNMEQIALGSSVTLKVPAFSDVEFGNFIESGKTPLNKLEKNIKKPMLTDKSLLAAHNFQELNGKVIWTNADSGEWCMGIEFENQALSKRLFEAVVSLQSRQKKGVQTQSIMKTSRAS